jgi:hypothetical protein
MDISFLIHSLTIADISDMDHAVFHPDGGDAHDLRLDDTGGEGRHFILFKLVIQNHRQRGYIGSRLLHGKALGKLIILRG